jgi:DNA-nicking Smr family endonuclease
VDARTLTKIRRGLLGIDATLDLHGHTRETGHLAVIRFVLESQAQGKKLVLIITGKGKAGKDGILKEELPRWLNETALRRAVIAYDNAGPRHGGGGAWYVRIRRFQL